MGKVQKNTKGILGQIIIENPCTRDWQSMTPAQKGRYCEHCKITVLDSPLITKMELRKAVNVAASSKSRVCVRLHREKHGRIIFRSVLRTLPLLGIIFTKFLPTVDAQTMETNYGDLRIVDNTEAILTYIEGSIGALLMLLSAIIAFFLSTLLLFGQIKKQRKWYLVFSALCWLSVLGIYFLRSWLAQSQFYQ